MKLFLKKNIQIFNKTIRFNRLIQKYSHILKILWLSHRKIDKNALNIKKY